MRHEYIRWRYISNKVSNKSFFELVHCVIHKLIRTITCILINGMFYSMRVLTIIITCSYFVELEVQENNFGCCMRTRVMKYAKGYYKHEEDIIGMLLSMGNGEIYSIGRRGRKEPIAMRILHREVHSYGEDNESIIKYQEEILQSLNMFHR